MFSPTYVQLKYWFYPIGNTPAVNLLRDLPSCQEEETINILSLACGDPRNVLFSLWCEQGHSSKRTVSFTCCDIEPAILARNVVLLTLITNGRPSTELWDLFYHFYVPTKTLSILRTHAAGLVEASKSTEKWASSPYGSYIKYVDKATLQELRRYWTRYASTEKFPQARTAIAQRSKETGNMHVLTGVRSAGPLWFHASETMAHVYREFWKTGVVAGNIEDLSRLNGKGEVNPMFAVSSAASRDFAVHYGAEPLLGFRLPEAFHQKVPEQRGGTSEQAKRAVAIAKSQFKAWCECFTKYVSNDRVQVSFFCGEALALSHDLQLAITLNQKPGHVTRTYVKPWSACPLLLDGYVSLNATRDLPYDLFDVIDTSNLGDHVGFINILSATTPLLRRNASSVVYTESLLMASEDISASLSTVLGSDVATFSMLIGLAPSGLLTGVTLDAVGNETALFTLMQGDDSQKQYRMRVSWKYPQFSDASVVGVLGSSTGSDFQVTFEAKELAGHLFDIYKTMFAHEDISRMTAQLSRMSVGQYSIDLQRYTRAGMAALLRLVRATVQVDWEQTMHLLDSHLVTDRSLIVGSNSLQELYMHLHIFGVWTNECLERSPNQLRTGFGLSLRPTSGDKGILAADNTPSVVQLVLVVPRENLTVFTGKTPDAIGTPALHVSVTQTSGQNQYENCFHSFQAFFGKVVYDDSTQNASIIEEDDHGWLGSADLVVTCAVPAFGLLMGPRNGILAALMINTNPDNLMKFEHLGVRMAVFETGFHDGKRLFVCRDAPKLDTLRSSSMQKRWIEKVSSQNQSSLQTLVKLNAGHRATHLQSHIDFPKDSAESQALSTGAAVTVIEYSPRSVMLRIGSSLKRQVTFPFPIQGSQPKTRIARKSSWIEVEVPIFTALDGDRFNSWTQATVFQSGRPPLCWSIPRINLELQPSVTFSKKGDSSWLRTFMGTTLSDAERPLSKPDQATTTNAKFDLKQSLNILFLTFVGLNENRVGPKKTFQLTLETTSAHTLIFATGIRHDLDLGSLVMEAYVVPLTIPRVKELLPSLKALQTTEPCAIRVSNDESTLWKRMLPALAERCRTWQHKSTCEYQNKGAPLSTEEGKSPLCSCGEGNVSGSELAKLGLKEWAPFAKYAVRVAIAPIFPVPYVESSLSELLKLPRATQSYPSPSSPPKLPSQAPKSAGTEAKCDHCGKSAEKLQVCGGCRKVRYCGSECQKAGRKEHKKDCVR